jgi:acetyl esterase/lipase
MKLAPHLIIKSQLLQENPPSGGLDSAPSIQALREHLAALKLKLTAASTSTSTSGPAQYVETDQYIPVRDNTIIPVRIHRPTTPPAEGSQGLVVWHGGGFCLGGLDNEVALCRRWTALGGVAVNVSYRLAPEHPFPQAVEDAYDSLLWVGTQSKFNISCLLAALNLFSLLIVNHHQL